MKGGVDLLSALHLIEGIARRSDAAAIADEAETVAARVGRREFFVACIGQFKRGKSTLLGALIGDPVLPTGVNPATAVPTIVRYGHEPSARLLVGREWREVRIQELGNYISHTVGARSGDVALAEVLLPAPILSSGLVLVDTPGLGSVFSSGTEATRTFVPHIDVAMAVIGVDPPISGDELGLIAEVASQTDHILVVLNKSDKVSEAERADARAFAERVIAERIGKRLTVYEVSATDQLSGRTWWPDWSRLEGNLRSLATTEALALSSRAGVRAVERLTARLDATLALQQLALTEPVKVAAERVRVLSGRIEEIHRSVRDLSAVLGGREIDLAASFGAEASAFLDAARTGAHHDLGARISELRLSFGPALRRSALAAAQTVAADVLARWRPVADARAGEAFGLAMRQMASAIGSLCRAAARDAESEAMLSAIGFDTATEFGQESSFHFSEQIAIAQPASPLRFIADTVLAAVGLRRVIVADAHRFLDWLLDVNVGRAESDLIERLRIGRQRLQTELARALAAVRSSAQVSLERGVRAREAGMAAVELELARISGARAQLAAIVGAAFTA